MYLDDAWVGAWSAAAPFTFGNAARVDPRLRTPARNNWNVATQKTERIASSMLTLRAEAINLLNAANLTGPAIAFRLPTEHIPALIGLV
jgi:hypothetical protein